MREIKSMAGGQIEEDGMKKIPALAKGARTGHPAQGLWWKFVGPEASLQSSVFSRQSSVFGHGPKKKIPRACKERKDGVPQIGWISRARAPAPHCSVNQAGRVKRAKRRFSGQAFDSMGEIKSGKVSHLLCGD
jgi:hypothetical protein